MQISKKTQYGLRAMVFLAKKYKQNKTSPIKDIAESEGISFDFLEKIFSDLEKARLVKGKKGIGGGYVLAKKPAQITVSSIVFPLEKTMTPVDCGLCGRARKCATKNVWRKIENSINKTLKSIKLSDLVK